MADSSLSAMGKDGDPWEAYAKLTSGNNRKTYFVPFAKADEERRLSTAWFWARHFRCPRRCRCRLPR